jgi:hypothetical protein
MAMFRQLTGSHAYRIGQELANWSEGLTIKTASNVHNKAQHKWFERTTLRPQ